MTPRADVELLAAYLDGELEAGELLALEARLKTEPRLAEQLLTLARDEATLTEWARAMVVAGATASTNGVLKTPAARTLPFTARRVVRVVLAASVAAAVLLAVGLYFWNRLPAPANEDALARLDEVQGEVFIILPSGEEVAARTGDGLQAGQELRTGGEGSFAAVRYADGTLIELSTDTRVRLLADGGAEEPDAGKRVFLAEGFVTADVARQPANRPMVLTTPHAVIRVLGTCFSSAALPESTRVELEEGRVQMTRKSDGQSIEIGKGRYAVAAVPEPAPVPVEPFAHQPLPPRITQPRATLPFGPGPVMTVAISPDGKTLAAGGSDGSVTLWDREALEVRLVLKGHAKKVRCLAFSADSRLLITGSDDKVVKVWDVELGQERLTLPRQRQEVDAVALSPDGRILATSAGFVRNNKEGAQLKLWDARTGEPLAHLAGHGGPVLGLAFAPDGKTLASGSRDGTVKLWDVVTGREQTTLQGHADWVACVTFSPDGKTLAAGGRDGSVLLWDVAAQIPVRTIRGHTREVRVVVFAPDSRTLATSATDGTARLWDSRTGQERLTLKAHKFAVTGVAFSPDGKILATCGWDRTVKVWDLTEPVALLGKVE